MITDADIKKMKTVFATKEDLKGFATKNDLKRFATKDDLKRFATKDDLKRFATKDDLLRFSTKDELSTVVRELISFIGTVKTDLSNQLNEFREEMRDINRTHQSTLNNHETRLSRLEYVNK